MSARQHTWAAVKIELEAAYSNLLQHWHAFQCDFIAAAGGRPLGSGRRLLRRFWRRALGIHSLQSGIRDCLFV